jgi:hypothetical protein
VTAAIGAAAVVAVSVLAGLGAAAGLALVVSSLTRRSKRTS